MSDRSQGRAEAALASDGQVQVKVDRWLVFEPASNEAETGLVFYPGGRVSPAAYAPAAHSLAASGNLVVIVSMPLNLAVFLLALYWLVGRPLGRFLRSRREGIAMELEQEVDPRLELPIVIADRM